MESLLPNKPTCPLPKFPPLSSGAVPCGVFGNLLPDMEVGLLSELRNQNQRNTVDDEAVPVNTTWDMSTSSVLVKRGVMCVGNPGMFLFCYILE